MRILYALCRIGQLTGKQPIEQPAEYRQGRYQREEKHRLRLFTQRIGKLFGTLRSNDRHGSSPTLFYTLKVSIGAGVYFHLISDIDKKRHIDHGSGLERR